MEHFSFLKRKKTNGRGKKRGAAGEGKIAELDGKRGREEAQTSTRSNHKGLQGTRAMTLCLHVLLYVAEALRFMF